MNYPSRMFMNYNLLLSILFLETFFSTLFVFNVKSLLISFLISAVLIFTVAKKKFTPTVLTLFFFALPFENFIRSWILYSSEQINIGFYEFIFGINLKLILAVPVLLLLILRRKKLGPTTHPKSDYLLVLFLLLSTISSLMFQTRAAYVLPGLTRLALAVLYYLSAKHVLQTEKHPTYFFIFFICLSIFSTYFGAHQLLKQKTLGRYIELTPAFAPHGYTTTDGVKQFRVSGFISHPVYFGSFISMLIPLVIASNYLAFVKKNWSRFLLLPLLLLATAATLGTLSRSTWINLVLVFGAFYFYVKHHHIGFGWYSNFFHRFKPVLLVLVFISTLPLFFSLFTRLESVTTLLSSQGNITMRYNLAKTGIQLAFQRPFTGIGLNNYPYEAKQFNHLGGFPPPPHNTIIIFLTELGIPTTLVFILFLFYLLYPRSNPFRWDPFKFGLWLSLLTFIISSQFHPLFNLDPTFDLFLFSSGIFSGLCQKKQT